MLYLKNTIFKPLEMTPKDKKQISKFLSLILRHKPETIGVTLDDKGWASVDEVLEKSHFKFTKEDLKDIVATNDKQRFALNETATKIRANQGHSLKAVVLDLELKTPPDILYHGTVSKYISNIKVEGLQKMSRQYVHLSENRDTATAVGARRGKPIILSVRALDMYNDGYCFFLSENKVWLTDSVPTKYITFK